MLRVILASNGTSALIVTQSKTKSQIGYSCFIRHGNAGNVLVSISFLNRNPDRLSAHARFRAIPSGHSESHGRIGNDRFWSLPAAPQTPAANSLPSHRRRAACCECGSAAPWAFSNAALRSEIASQIRRMTGLATISQGHAVFVVLPQPHVSIDDVSFTDPSGALRIDAHYLKGYVRLASLFAGRIEITSATLGQPKLRSISIDGRCHSDSVIGRAADASAGNC